MNDSKYTTYFVNALETSSDNLDIDENYLYPNCVYFKPMKTSWNDFLYKTRYTFRITGENSETIAQGMTHLGFITNEKKYAAFDYFDESYLLPSKELPDFYTLLGGMDDYLNFISREGTERSRELLSLLKDVVEMKYSGGQDNKLEKIIKSGVFTLAIFRNAERFLAFHNAERYLRGERDDEIGDIPDEYNLSYKLSGFSNEHAIALKFNFNKYFPKRIAVLIGENGLGKSQALNNIARSILYEGESQFSKALGSHGKLHKLIAVSTPGETVRTFPRRNSSSSIKYEKILLGRDSSVRHFDKFGYSVGQLFVNNVVIGGFRKWSLFLRMVYTLGQYNSIVVPISDSVEAIVRNRIDVSGRSYLRLADLDKQKEQATLEIIAGLSECDKPLHYSDGSINELSSGQITFLQFALKLCLHIEGKSLVLIDEPETHMHPKLISDLIGFLNEILTATNSICVIATHSSYVVREVPSSQVSVFKKEDDFISILKPHLQTFGADVGDISYFVFNEERNNVLVEELVEKLRNISDEEKLVEVFSNIKKDISAEVLAELRRKLDLERGSETNNTSAS
ncbi:MAG: AAA family ATPase [Cytophagia bacterium]|nr:AAA family ATPase [Cytophagia bacterium]